MSNLYDLHHSITKMIKTVRDWNDYLKKKVKSSEPTLSSLFQNTKGKGVPLATQVKLTAEPVLTVTDAGDLVMEDITMTVTLDAWCSVPGQGRG